MSYRFTSKYRGMMIFAGILMLLLVLTIPFGIWFIVIGVRGRVVLGDEEMAVTHFTTKRIRYADVARLGQMQVAISGQGILGLLLARWIYGASHAQHLIVKDPRGKEWAILTHLYEQTDEILAEIPKRVGKEPEVVTQGLTKRKWPE